MAILKPIFLLKLKMSGLNMRCSYKGQVQGLFEKQVQN